MILGLAIFGGIFWFLYLTLILYAKQTPEAQVRRRLHILIKRAEESRAKTKSEKLPDKLNDETKKDIQSNSDLLIKKNFSERVFKPILHKFENGLNKLAPTELIKMIEDRIFRAGKQGIWSVSRLVALWVLSFAAGTLSAFMYIRYSQLQFSQNIIILLIGAIVGSVLPFLIMNSKIKERKKALRRQLPEFLDLLCVSVQAGLSFEGAVSKIVSRMKGALVDEFKRMQSDVSLGMPHQYALTQLAKRCDLEEMYLFTSSVIQAERLGTSMSRTLKMQADNMRDRHKQYVKAEALKAPVKIIFPMVIFIFPAIFVVLLFPAILSLMKTLGN